MNHDEITTLGHAIAKSLKKNGGSGQMRLLTKWILGSMFTLVIIFGGSAIRMVLSRIEKTEAVLDERAPLVIGGAIEIENLKEWQEEVEEDFEEVKEEIKTIKDTVGANSKKLDGALEYLGELHKQVLPEKYIPRTR